MYEEGLCLEEYLAERQAYTGPIENIKNDTWFDPEICTPAVVLPNRSESALLVFGQGGYAEDSSGRRLSRPSWSE